MWFCPQQFDFKPILGDDLSNFKGVAVQKWVSHSCDLDILQHAVPAIQTEEHQESTREVEGEPEIA